MMRDFRPSRRLLAAAALVIGAQLDAQSATTASFVTTRGKDTVAIEQYTRLGNAITGMWIQHQAHHVFVHNYTLVLGTDGWPTHFSLSLYTPRPHTYLMTIIYDADSATRVVVIDSAAVTRRVAMKHAYPALFGSVVGWELALARARSVNADSSSAIVDREEPQVPVEALSVKFFGADSVRVGTSLTARLDRGGRLLALRSGPQDIQRVPSLDVAKLIADFNAADAVGRVADSAASALRRTADSAAIATRVAITLPPPMLDRLVGDYILNPVATLVISRDGDKLMARLGQRPVLELDAVSATTFYPKGTNAKLEFQTDASGAVTGVALDEGGTLRLAPKVKR